MDRSTNKKQKEERSMQDLSVPSLRVTDQEMDEDADMEDTPEVATTARSPTRQEWLAAHTDHAVLARHRLAAAAQSADAVNNTMFAQVSGRTSSQFGPAIDQARIAQQDQGASAQRSTYNAPSIFRHGSSIDQAGIAQQDRSASAQQSTSSAPSMSRQTQGLGFDQRVISYATDRRVSEQISSTTNVLSVFARPLGQNANQPGSTGPRNYYTTSQGVFIQRPGAAGVSSSTPQGNQQWPLKKNNVPSMFAQNWPLTDKNVPSLPASGQYSQFGKDDSASTSAHSNRQFPAKNKNTPSMFAGSHQSTTQQNKNVPSMFTGNNGPMPSKPAFSDPAIVAQGKLTFSDPAIIAQGSRRLISENNSGFLHPSAARRRLERVGIDRLRQLAPHHLHPSAPNPPPSSAAIARLRAADAATMPPPPAAQPRIPTMQSVLPQSNNRQIVLVGNDVTPPTLAHHQAYLAGTVEDRFRRNFEGPREPFEHPVGHFHSVDRASMALQGFLNKRDRALASHTDVENVPPVPGSPWVSSSGSGSRIASEWDDSDGEKMEEDG